ncbi:MAG: OmpH family outer membrane protein [Candidatus Hydrogenedentes bacterium]|nr:OmpH family outer membrane protein [Candidatus Hydrogenedentota bacterium]
MNAYSRSMWVALTVVIGLTLLGAEGNPASDAAKNAPSGQYKIGVVDRKKVFDEYNRQKEEMKKLQDQVEAEQKEVDNLVTPIEADKKRYEDNKDKMSDQEREALKDKIEQAARKYQTIYKEKQADIDSRTAKLLRSLKDEINQAISEVGARDNYHLIFEADPKSGTSVLYYSSTLDMTPKVIEYLNSKK